MEIKAKYQGISVIIVGFANIGSEPIAIFYRPFAMVKQLEYSKVNNFIME